MIVLYTDFGWNGPYVGQMKAALVQQAPGVHVIDLMHDVPKFNAKAGAYLLASLIERFPNGTVFLCVVDPGVGSERLPCIVKADDYWFVGPDNGLFNIVLNHAKVKNKWEIVWQPQNLSTSFHGRDLFAPIAAEIAKNNKCNSNKISKRSIGENDWPNVLNEIIYIDNYGNCITGLTKEYMTADIHNNDISCHGFTFRHADTFSAVNKDEALWYINSIGLCELAVNQGNAAHFFNFKIGDQINL